MCPIFFFIFSLMFLKEKFSKINLQKNRRFMIFWRNTHLLLQFFVVNYFLRRCSSFFGNSLCMLPFFEESNCLRCWYTKISFKFEISSFRKWQTKLLEFYDFVKKLMCTAFTHYQLKYLLVNGFVTAHK